ncbi:MAG TPA: aspartate--tRNA ligase, partial [Thermoanaerobaculia bacterium]|nr:aspartate--tRNA ligase [Thermoanaerobaculia bacterium]
MSPPSRTPAGILRPSDAGRTVRLQGWVNRRRDHGDLVFIDLRDRSGLAQVVFDARFLPEPALLALAKELRSEFVVDVTGVVEPRAADAVNPDLATGGVEVRATALAILNRADTPPFPIEDGIKASEDLRLKYRYLDLRRPEMTRRFAARSAVTMAIREVLHEEGFLDVETPILTKSTPEGARDFLVPSRIHEGEFYALPQSPQLFKQLLMVSGIERYYQIARCFRDEDLRADRQLEFTQVDIEMSFPTEEMVYALVEKIFTRVFPKWGIACEAPFRRMTYDEAMERFGIDRPDTRFGLELGSFQEMEEKLSSKVERVKGLRVPGGAGFSRKRLDDIEKGARAAGVDWFFWVKTGGPGGWNSNSKKFFDDAAIERMRASFGAGESDLVFLAAGKAKNVLDFLGALRLQIAREEKLIPEGRHDFLWVTGFPLVEWHEEDGRWYATHHPFTSPREEDLPFLESDPARVKARAYDVVLNGMELGGGSIRIHRPDVQSRVFTRLGIGEEEARAK